MAKYEDKKTVRCSFCGKPQENVRRIIAGPGVYICDECVGLCSNIIEEEFEEMYSEEEKLKKFWQLQFIIIIKE